MCRAEQGMGRHMALVAEVLARVDELLDAEPQRGGALWSLAEEGRQLDANVVRLTAGARVERHVEAELDVLLYVVGGSGELQTDEGARSLATGTVTWLPRGSGRTLSAGADGLAYLTVHRRRPGMSIGGTRTARAEDVGSQGGESACLLDQVCAECGRMSPERTARFCGNCGSRLPRD